MGEKPKGYEQGKGVLAKKPKGKDLSSCLGSETA